MTYIRHNQQHSYTSRLRMLLMTIIMMLIVMMMINNILIIIIRHHTDVNRNNNNNSRIKLGFRCQSINESIYQRIKQTTQSTTVDPCPTVLEASCGGGVFSSGPRLAPKWWLLLYQSCRQTRRPNVRYDVKQRYARRSHVSVF